MGHVDPDDLEEIEAGEHADGTDVTNAKVLLETLGVSWEDALADAVAILEKAEVWSAVEAVASRLLPDEPLTWQDLVAIPEVARLEEVGELGLAGELLRKRT